jgi:hypothetical protein
MERINIKKAELLEKLNRNLLLCSVVYQETMTAFKANYKKRLTEMLEAGEKDKFDFNINLQQPQNHEQEYKNAIKMVSMDCREIIVLSEEEFRHYILNQWDWIRSFHMSYTSNLGYSGYGSTSSFVGLSSPSVEAQEFFGDDVD